MRSRRIAWLHRLGALSIALWLTACATSTTVTDAARAWRQGRRSAALAAAQIELDRFKTGNGVNALQISTAVEAVDRWFSEERPLVLAGDELRSEDTPPPDPHAAPGGLRATLRADLLSAGTSRALRALHTARWLGDRSLAPLLLAILWSPSPYEVDGPLLSGESTAIRALAIKQRAYDLLASWK